MKVCPDEHLYKRTLLFCNIYHYNLNISNNNNDINSNIYNANKVDNNDHLLRQLSLHTSDLVPQYSMWHNSKQ